MERWKWLIMLLFLTAIGHLSGKGKVFNINREYPVFITPEIFSSVPTGGDTLFVDSSREESILLNGFEGDSLHPIVIINKGRVVINSITHQSAIELRGCKYIKLCGSGSSDFKYGFELSAINCGIAVNRQSTNIEIGQVKIEHNGFFGISVKDDYHGTPPDTLPFFEELVVHDCLIKGTSVGMYLGETTSPGMEFRHVRIYNNVVMNTRREGIQVANMVDDIEVYNNLVMNSGISNEGGQGNNIQIGDNTIGNFYNNIVINAFEYGFIVFGSGDIDIYNNYIANNRGIFIDNRKETDPLAEISVSKNYFSNISLDNVLVNYNELNPMRIFDNKWEGRGNFYHDISPKNPDLVVENNSVIQIEPLVFTDSANGDFNLSSQNPDHFKMLGPQPGLGHQFNNTPELGLLNNLIIEIGTDTTLLIYANTIDHDSIEMTIEPLPPFAKIRNSENGRIELQLSPKEEHEGIFKILITASDFSHRAKARRQFSVAVRSKENSPPEVNFPKTIEAWVNTHQQFPISYTDADGDIIAISSENLPPFVKLICSDQQYVLDVHPRYVDSGVYNQLGLICTDGFNEPVYIEFLLVVEKNTLSPGDVIFRVNCGGPDSADEPIDWEGNYKGRLLYELSINHSTGSHSWNGINPTNAPSCIFGPWNYTLNQQPMHWLFPCENGEYTVNLFFAEREQDISMSNESVFSIEINKELVSDNFSIYKQAGLNALKKTFFTTVSDNQIEIKLLPIKNHVKLHGIEIKYARLPGEQFNLSSEAVFHLFPNPITDWFYLFPMKEILAGVYTFEIFDLRGRLKERFLLKANNPEYLRVSLNQSNIENGLYFFWITNELGQREVFKLLVAI
jgi:hypothetical protein